MKKYITGIGSRKTPKNISQKINELSRYFVDAGFILRSGGADGSDSMWESSYSVLGGNAEIYLPWPGFNKNTSGLYGVSEQALSLASTVHHKWDSLKPSGKLLHGRNVYQVLGTDLKTRSDILICWTPNGEIVGGTATAIKLAKTNNIPVFNLAIPDDVLKLDCYVAFEKNQL